MRNQIEKIANKLKYSPISALKKSEITDDWDYRLSGIKTLSEAKKRIKIEIMRQKLVGTRRYKNRPIPAQKSGRFSALIHKRLEIKKILGKMRSECTADSLWDAQAKTLCTYPYVSPSVRLGAGLIKIDFEINEDWDFYSKSYGKPKTTIRNKRIEVFTGRIILDRKNRRWELAKTVIMVESFRGNWLFNALAVEWKLPKMKIEKRLKVVRLNQWISCKKMPFSPSCANWDGVEMYRLNFGEFCVGYCALALDGTTFHGVDAESALGGLRRKQKSAAELLGEILTKKTGLALGFCIEGILSFCAENDLNPEGEYSRLEIKKIVLKNQSVNKKYRDELKKLAITV